MIAMYTMITPESFRHNYVVGASCLWRHAWLAPPFIITRRLAQYRHKPGAILMEENYAKHLTSPPPLPWP